MRREIRLKRIFVILIAVSLTVAMAGCIPEYPDLLYGSEGSDDSLLVVQRGYLFGYADPTGELVIKPGFSDARPFHEGLAAARKGGKYGYIDSSGKTVLPFKYDLALDFHNGKAIVAVGYVESEAPVEDADFFDRVRIPKYRIIDRNGNVVRELDSTWIGQYSDGVTVVSRSDSGDMLYLDEDFNEVILPGSGSIFEFSDGMAVLYLDSGGYSYIDKQGNRLSYETNAARPFSEGLAAVRDEGGFGYIDTSGKFAIAPQYQDAGQFGEGLACAMTRGGEFRIIDTTGKVLSSIKDVSFYVDMSGSGFSEGLCSVWRSKGESSRYGFIDSSGKLVIDCIYEEVTPFQNGIAEVVYKTKIGYIDRTGKYIWEPK